MNPTSAGAWLATLGPYAATGVFLILLVETALPIGFLLPGDTLLLTAGIACASGRLSLPLILAAAFTGTVLGAQLGYGLGRYGRHVLLPGARTGRIHRAMVRLERLTERHGPGPALLIARFIPVARSVTGPLAGLLRIPVRAFVLWQVIGALIWTTGTTLAGYTAARLVPALTGYLPLLLALAALAFPLTAATGYLAVRLRARARARGHATVPPATPTHLIKENALR